MSNARAALNEHQKIFTKVGDAINCLVVKKLAPELTATVEGKTKRISQVYCTNCEYDAPGQSLNDVQEYLPNSAEIKKITDAIEERKKVLRELITKDSLQEFYEATKKLMDFALVKAKNSHGGMIEGFKQSMLDTIAPFLSNYEKLTEIPVPDYLTQGFYKKSLSTQVDASPQNTSETSENPENPQTQIPSESQNSLNLLGIVNLILILAVIGYLKIQHQLRKEDGKGGGETSSFKDPEGKLARHETSISSFQSELSGLKQEVENLGTKITSIPQLSDEVEELKQKLDELSGGQPTIRTTKTPESKLEVSKSDEIVPQQEVLYFRSPERGGFFYKKKGKTRREEMSKFEVHKMYGKLELSIVPDSNNIHRSAINDIHDSLEPVCDIEEVSSNGRKITVYHKGELQEENLSGQIIYRIKPDKKLKIKIE